MNKRSWKGKSSGKESTSQDKTKGQLEYVPNYSKRRDGVAEQRKISQPEKMSEQKDHASLSRGEASSINSSGSEQGRKRNSLSNCSEDFEIATLPNVLDNTSNKEKSSELKTADSRKAQSCNVVHSSNTQMKHKELGGNSSVNQQLSSQSVEFNIRDFRTCGCEATNGLWSLLKEAIVSHPRKDFYVEKVKELFNAHSVKYDWSEDIENQFSAVGNIPDVQLQSRASVEVKKYNNTFTDSTDFTEHKMDFGAAGRKKSIEESASGDWYKAMESEGRSDCQEKNKERYQDSHSRDRDNYYRKGNKKDNSFESEQREDGDNNRRYGNWRKSDQNDKLRRESYDRGGRRGNPRDERKKYKIVTEINGDLFEAPKDHSLAHCVATDLRMGSGIAVNFRQTFKSVGILLDQKPRVGNICVLEDENRYIYYLITKKFSNGKPYFDDLVSSLNKMKEHCAEHGVKLLAMPRIGCGLDRLEWREVKPMIEHTFSDMDIKITVYNLNQRWGRRSRSRNNSQCSSGSSCIIKRHKNKKEKSKTSGKSQTHSQKSSKTKKGKNKKKNF